MLAAVAALGTGAVALAGAPVPPNDGDDAVAKAGGLRYSADGRLADAGPVEAGCGPARWRTIGGGGGVTGTTSERSLRTLRPVDFDDADDAFDEGWSVGGIGPAGSVATAQAICARGERIRYRVKDAPPSPAELRSANVGCGGGGFRVTAGGVRIGSADSFISSSFPHDGGDRDRRPDDGWTGKVLDSGLAGFEVYAICVRGAVVDYRKKKPATIPTDSALTRRVGCGKKGHAVGGGARITDLINRGRIADTQPYDGPDADEAPDDGWRTTGLNLSSGAPRKLVPYAICLR